MANVMLIGLLAVLGFVAFMMVVGAAEARRGSRPRRSGDGFDADTFSLPSFLSGEGGSRAHGHEHHDSGGGFDGDSDGHGH